MRVLLDTHALMWWVPQDSRLSGPARALIEADETEVHVSIASAWEIAIKVGAGKWPEAAPFLNAFETAVVEEQFQLIQLTVAHVRAAGLIQSAHRDPFDRLLAAQGLLEGLTLVTSDGKLKGLGAETIW